MIRFMCRHENCDREAEMFGEWCRQHRMVVLDTWRRLKGMRLEGKR